MKVRANAVLAVVLAVVLALAAATAWVVTSRQAEPPDLTTPEGTARAYVEAAILGDQQALRELVLPGGRCKPPYGVYPTDPGSGVTLRVGQAEVEGDRATVSVEIEEADTGLGSWAHEENLNLERVDGRWLVEDSAWPLYGCE